MENRPEPCPCRNPFPAIRVQGRARDLVTFRTAKGEQVSIPPLAFEIDHSSGIERIQGVQTSPTCRWVCLLPAAGGDIDQRWKQVGSQLDDLPARHQLGHVVLERAGEPPALSLDGKYRAVIPLHAGPAT